MALECRKGRYRIHLWKGGDDWKIVVGVSRCEFCGELSKPEHFEVMKPPRVSEGSTSAMTSEGLS